MSAADRLAEIRERAERATDGPWLRGQRWWVQGTSRCQCHPDYGPLIHQGRMDINGKLMQAHVHEAPAPWHSPGITVRPSAQTGWHVGHVVVEADEYGLMDDADAEFIAHAREDVPRLVALAADLLELAGEWKNAHTDSNYASDHIAVDYKREHGKILCNLLDDYLGGDDQ